MGEQGCSRRAVLGAGVAGIGVLGLASCGNGSGSSGPPRSSSPASGSAGVTLTKVADVPAGGSVAASAKLDGKPVLVSRNKSGTVAAFVAICTHMGCTVNPAGAEFHCPCHGSVYDAFTGKVLHGPAPDPLPAVPITVSGGNVITQ